MEVRVIDSIPTWVVYLHRLVVGGQGDNYVENKGVSVVTINLCHLDQKAFPANLGPDVESVVMLYAENETVGEG